MRRSRSAILPPAAEDFLRNWKRRIVLRRFYRRGSVPFSDGYFLHKTRLVDSVIRDPNLMETFRNGNALPDRYGVGVDERCVEYPWLLSRLSPQPGRLLDAGSVLNQEHILRFPAVSNKRLTILTLAPEEVCYWNKGISYVYDDVRQLPFRDDCFDEIACISTVEHVGCDNSAFTGSQGDREHRPEEYQLAVRELARVLKPHGSLYLTVPYGQYNDFGVFQQFDQARLNKAIAAFGKAEELQRTFYRYSADGWKVAGQQDCDGCQYVEWVPKMPWPDPLPIEADRAAAARAVACLHFRKL